MPSLSLPVSAYVPQTSIAHRPGSPGTLGCSPLHAQASAIFFRSSATTPLFEDESHLPCFDLDYKGEKFVAGRACAQMLSASEEVTMKDERTSASTLFFSAANPTDPATRARFARAYENHAYDGQSIRREIGQEALARSRETAGRLAAAVPREQVLRNQAKFINPLDGSGNAYLHARDNRHERMLAMDGPIHTFLPGYATGDRYSLILAMLIDPRLHVSVAYSVGNQHEQDCAREAANVIRTALQRNGEPDAANRVSIHEYSGPSLKAARESLDSAETRGHFKLIDGSGSPLSTLAPTDRDPHVFHISATTELIARRFRQEQAHAAPLPPDAPMFKLVRGKLDALVPAEERHRIDALVDQVIAEQDITTGSAGLWIADREFANARESEAISRPAMFEQIADSLKAAGTPVYCIADTYINRVKDDDGRIRLFDRHPYRPEMHPHIGRFWAAEVDGKRPLAPRENQWYFMNRLLEKVGGPLIGIRSGALEPFALMGHQVIYLEHDHMFTPERHACWQNVIPYHRLVTAHTTGYLGMGTEVSRASLIDQVINTNLAMKQGLGPLYQGYPRASSATAVHARQRLDTINEDLQAGVLNHHELELLHAMVRGREPAWQAANRLWNPPAGTLPAPA